MSNCVQNFPNCVAKLRRDLLAALANHVSVNCRRNRRTVGVPESLLTQFLRCPETGGGLISFANTNRLRPMLRRCAAPRGKMVCEAGCSNRSWRIRAQTEAPHQVSTCIKRGIFQRSIGALAGLQGPHPRDSLASGDKGHECRNNGPRSRPQGPHVWPHLRSLLCLTQVGSRNMWRRFEQRKIHRPKNVEQVRQARLEWQPRGSVAGVRHAPRRHALHDVQVKADHVLSPQQSPSGAFVRRTICAHNR